MDTGTGAGSRKRSPRYDEGEGTGQGVDAATEAFRLRLQAIERAHMHEYTLDKFAEKFMKVPRGTYSNRQRSLLFWDLPIGYVVQSARVARTSLELFLAEVADFNCREFQDLDGNPIKSQEVNSADRAIAAVRALPERDRASIVPQLLELIKDCVAPAIAQASETGEFVMCEGVAARLRELLNQQKIDLTTTVGRSALAVAIADLPGGGSAIDRLAQIARGEVSRLDQADIDLIAYTFRRLGQDDSVIRSAEPCDERSAEPCADDAACGSIDRR